MLTPKKSSYPPTTPKNIFIFLGKKQNIEIQKFEPQKMGQLSRSVWLLQDTAGYHRVP